MRDIKINSYTVTKLPGGYTVPCTGVPKLRGPSKPDHQTIDWIIEKFSHLRNINKQGCSNPTLIMATYLKKKKYILIESRTFGFLNFS